MILFLLVGFGIPWVGWTLSILTGLDQQTPRGPWATLLFYTGVSMSVAGILATFSASRMSGVRHLLKRSFRIRAPVFWILFALFIPLVWRFIWLLLWGLTHEGIGRVEPSGFLLFFAPGVLLALTTGPLGEEFGWRGYLLPRFLKRFSPFAACSVLGLIWSLWHVPLYWRAFHASRWEVAVFTICILCYTFWLTLLWVHTRASIFWAIILHWTINISRRVSANVLPDIQPEGGAGTLLNLGVIVGLTLVTVIAVGPSRLKRKVTESLVTLNREMQILPPK